MKQMHQDKTTVPVAQLKARLSEYLRAVKAGTEVVITERGRPVARLVPVGGETGTESRLQALLASGLVRAPRARRDPAFWTRPRPSDPTGRALEILLEEREEGW